MEKNKLYVLPQLSFGLKDLEPYMSEQQLTIHYQKHHQAYVNGANNILQKLDKAHKENADWDVKATLKELSFNIGGHVLHSLFWGSLAPASKGGGGKPGGRLGEALEKEFGSFERFKKEFSQAATSVEGSGWAALCWCRQTNRPLLMQIEKHNTNVYPMFRILMVLDVFEHAYYLDYKNDRAKFVEAFWSIVNWDGINERLQEILE
jgi:Fe-Mn family superoxide dismutase